MRHIQSNTPQFYVTAPQPCPYLHGRTERKLFTALPGDNSGELNNALSRQGFRRSQNVLYRPSCDSCTACLSARISVKDFSATRSQNRNLRRNNDLQRVATSAWTTDEQYALFRRYLDARHSDGGMAEMDAFEFASMIEETSVPTRVIEYRRPALADDIPERAAAGSSVLVAACLTDILDDGLSLVYSFYDPDEDKRSLGTYMILDHIEIARAASLPYIYLGYWVPGSRKMDYKIKFNALEIYKGGVWQDIDAETLDPREFFSQPPLPVTEQVTSIALPNGAVRKLRKSAGI